MTKLLRVGSVSGKSKIPGSLPLDFFLPLSESDPHYEKEDPVPTNEIVNSDPFFLKLIFPKQSWTLDCAGVEEGKFSE